MSSFASLLLLSVVLSDLSLSSVEGFSWCPLIKPNDTYKGLTLYNRLDRNNIVEYWMNNKEGMEWRFDVTTDGQLRPDNTSIRNVKPIVISSQVSTLVTRFVSLNGQKVLDCDLYRHEDNQTKLIYCGKQKWPDKKLKDFPRKYIFVGPFTLDKSSVLFVELNKKDKTKTRFSYIFVEGEPKVDREKCSSDRRHEKVCDLFVDRMNDNLYRRLDSSLRFYGNESNEELLLFKIKNRPKYCFQSLEENSNKECNSIDSMNRLFEECFVWPNSPVSGENRSDVFLVVIVVVIIVVLIMAILIVYALIKRRPNNERRHSSGSKSETFSKVFAKT